MKVFEILEQEHERILEMLDVLDAVRGQLDRETAAPEDDLKNVVRFFRRYADACHHAKEENTLFPALEAAGLPCEGGPIGVMLHEHVEGRNLVSAMARAAKEPNLLEDYAAYESREVPASEKDALLEVLADLRGGYT